MEIRDPIHNFIKFDDDERLIIDSKPFQRLRNIHQLGLTYLLYPGATHKRFEHSLGVMELATRIYDIVTADQNIDKDVRDLCPIYKEADLGKRSYWRKVLRIAALCHDLGHLPFSHTAEEELKSMGIDHEFFSKKIILETELKNIFNKLIPPPMAEHVVKIALGPEKLKETEFSDWEKLVSDIIVGDAFGADRIDYLLRDSHHLGVGYGKFDHYRLVDTLRILPSPAATSADKEKRRQICLGIEEGGIYTLEALLLSRYFMFTQVYYHHVRRVYDKHLRDFLVEILDFQQLIKNPEKILSLTDNQILIDLDKSLSDQKRRGHLHAMRILERKHFRLIYKSMPIDFEYNINAPYVMFESLKGEFGEKNVILDEPMLNKPELDFSVKTRDNQYYPVEYVYANLKNIPAAYFHYIFINPEMVDDASKWIVANREKILEKK